MKLTPLSPAFFARHATSVARDCLGRLLVSDVGGTRAVVRLVEVEAYTGPRDAASHCAGWHRSERNESMYGPPGRAYVYFTYGMHWCFNIVTGRAGYPCAVLVRAGEPLSGLEVMRERRGGVPDHLLASGPARLAQALGVTRALDGHDLREAPLWLADAPAVTPRRYRRGPRIGISKARERPLRFFEVDNVHVSR